MCIRVDRHFVFEKMRFFRMAKVFMVIAEKWNFFFQQIRKKNHPHWKVATESSHWCEILMALLTKTRLKWRCILIFGFRIRNKCSNGFSKHTLCSCVQLSSWMCDANGMFSSLLLLLLLVQDAALHTHARAVSLSLSVSLFLSSLPKQHLVHDIAEKC